MDVTTENYQLKWHAFGSNLHSWVATSMTMQQFTDVILVAMDGYQIAAHRFILSACSQYLQDILKVHCNASTTTNYPVMIILPPEISSKSLKVLMEYMYSGKATVSKDVLENVLRGGDLLKIKGLWHGSKDAKDRNIQAKSCRKPQEITQHIQGSINNVTNTMPRKASHQHSVITSMETFLSNNPNESFTREKKEVETQVRNDPNENKTNARVIPTTHSKVYQPLDIEIEEAQPKLAIKQEPIEWSEVSEQDMEEIHVGDYPSTSNMDAITEMTIKPEIMLEDDADLDEERIINSNVDTNNTSLPSLGSFRKIGCTTSAKTFKFAVEAHDTSSTEGGELYTPLTCELCAETYTLPKDWVKHVQTHTDMMPAKRKRRGRISSDDESSNTFPPLQCDLCQTFYITPAEWVQHIERSHSVTELRFSNMDKSIKPGPSKILSESKEYIGMSGGQDVLPSLASTSGQLKECSVCKKSFPSHASMMIHSRTHTGERPYNCDYCCKGFNVKSNLLRHLRTLHDKIINSSEIESKDTDTIH